MGRVACWSYFLPLPLDRKAPSLQELSTRFRSWVESAGLASKTRKYYANGWRLLSSTSIVGMRLDHNQGPCGALPFRWLSSELKLCITNVAPDAPHRMLHKGEEWNLLIKVAKFKLWPAHGRKLRPDDNAEEKLLTAAKSCNWKPEIVRAVSGCHHSRKGHGNEERERALSYPYGKPGLEQSNHLRARQQDCRWEKNDPDERSRIRSAPSPRRR